MNDYNSLVCIISDLEYDIQTDKKCNRHYLDMLKFAYRNHQVRYFSSLMDKYYGSDRQ